jgi:hypothetical protein
MLKSKIEKIKNKLNELNEKNRRYFGIVHNVDKNYYECLNQKFDTLEAVKNHFGITDFDNVIIIELVIAKPRENEQN